MPTDPHTAHELRYAILQVLLTYGAAARSLQAIATRVAPYYQGATPQQVATELADLVQRGYVANLTAGNPYLPGVYQLRPAGRDQVELTALTLDPAIHGPGIAGPGATP